MVLSTYLAAGLYSRWEVHEISWALDCSCVSCPVKSVPWLSSYVSRTLYTFSNLVNLLFLLAKDCIRLVAAARLMCGCVPLIRVVWVDIVHLSSDQWISGSANGTKDIAQGSLLQVIVGQSHFPFLSLLESIFLLVPNERLLASLVPMRYEI